MNEFIMKEREIQNFITKQISLNEQKENLDNPSSPFVNQIEKLNTLFNQLAKNDYEKALLEIKETDLVKSVEYMEDSILKDHSLINDFLNPSK